MPCVLTGSTIITRENGGGERVFVWDISQADYEVELAALTLEVRC